MQKKSPFKDNALLKSEIEKFLKAHGSTFAQEAKRTSSFFELAAYNYLIRFYQSQKYEVTAKNLKATQFIYALSPSANPQNCSYFEATRTYSNGEFFTFEIRHNLRLQSSHDAGIFVTPDYSVVLANTMLGVKRPDYYNGKVDFHYVEAHNLKSFGETKHYQPGAELVLNFVGLVNELMPHLMIGKPPMKKPKHLGPSLFISGVGNDRIKRIGISLKSRYSVNVFLGLFASPSQVYSQGNQANVVKIGSS